MTTTTHKTLRGPRSGIIFFRKTDRHTGAGTDLEARVNGAVFPGLQGGPHNNVVAGVAVALRQAMQPAFVEYIRLVRRNAAALAKHLAGLGYRIVTGGTDNHLLLLDLRPLGLTGSKAEKILEAVHITVNKNTLPGDKNAVSPGGVRIGSAALTSRGFQPHHFIQVGDFIHEALQIGLALQLSSGAKLLKHFMAVLGDSKDLLALGQRVRQFCEQFPVPGQP